MVASSGSAEGDAVTVTVDVAVAVGEAEALGEVSKHARSGLRARLVDLPSKLVEGVLDLLVWG